jgi:hypothetical protein
MSERTKIEIEQTLAALKPLALSLRHRGYDANVYVEARGDEEFTVEIRVSVPPKGVPIESIPMKQRIDGAAV